MAFLLAAICATCLSAMTRTCEANMPAEPIFRERLPFPLVRLCERDLVVVPSWSLPENDRLFGDLPRPPMPVGESLRSAM